MVGASISEASGEGIGSSSILSRKRQTSSVSPTDGAKKRSTTMQMDLEILECPICYETLSIPIFQCDNGHLACSSCCPKLRNKCPACSLPIGHSRCRAMETVLKSISLPCPNAKYGCNASVSYGEESTHVKECFYSQCSCPISDCNFAGSYNYLFTHYVTTHMDPSRLDNMFSCGISFTATLNISKNMLVRMEFRRNLLFAVQCFRELYGVYVTVSCIAPSPPGLGDYSYRLSYTVDGHTVIYESPEVKRVLEVSYQPPQENAMLIPNSLLRGEMLEMKICVNKLKQK